MSKVISYTNHPESAAHFDIIENECADAIANYQAKQDKSNAGIVVLIAEADSNPFYNSSWLAFEQISTSTQNPNLGLTHLPQGLNTSQTFRMP